MLFFKFNKSCDKHFIIKIKLREVVFFTNLKQNFNFQINYFLEKTTTIQLNVQIQIFKSFWFFHTFN